MVRIPRWLTAALLSVLATGPAVAATTAFIGATLIDGTGRAPVADSVIVATDGRIVAAGRRNDVAIPQGATRVDVTGKVVMPGLINAHGHLFFDPNSAVPPRTQLVDQLALYARYGITMVQSLGDDSVESIALRDALRQAPGDGGTARLLVSGPILNPRSVAEARTDVDDNAARRVDMIKIRLEGPADIPIRQPAVYGAVIDQAHADGLRLAVHMFTADDTAGLVRAGADILAHSIRDRDADPALIAEIKRRDVGYIPTLTRDLSVFVYESRPDFIDDPFFTREASFRAPLAALLTPEAQAKVRADPQAQSIKAALVQAKRNLKLLADGGVRIAMGSDTGAPTGRWQGYFEHLELEMMVDAGLTPMQALVAATGDAAHVLRIADRLGTLQPGREADLIVLGANPLDDIRNTRSLEQVWIAGRRLH